MPSTLLRQRLPAARHVVIKLGTQLLTAPNGQLDHAYFHNIARQTQALRARGLQVTIVSSGAVGAGMAHLSLHERPTDVSQLQAVASVGQPQLMRHMREAFEPLNLKVGQLLLTRSDFEDRVRFLNMRNCILSLHAMGCIPIVNENDTVAVDEIRFGDNDTLAAMLCHALQADALILLTVVDGLLDGQGQVIDLVEDFAQAGGHIRSDKSKLGSGGMITKHTAARLMTLAGELTLIANGRTPDILLRLLTGEKLGTLFAPAQRKMEGRKRWIGLTKRPCGTLVIDSGASRAIVSQGKSLLASGILKVEGDFDKGAVLLVRDEQGRELARGLTNYNAEELDKIRGKKSQQFEVILGRASYDEVIHRDNLVLLI